MRWLGWLAAIVATGLLYLVGTDDPSPPKEGLPTPTVTVTTASPPKEVAVPTVPEPCQVALADAERVAEAVRVYEAELAKLEPIHADTSKAIANGSMKLLNKAKQEYIYYENESALGIQNLMLAIGSLESSIAECQEEFKE